MRAAPRFQPPARQPGTASGHLRLGDALDRSEPLSRLLRQMQASRARLDTVQSLLPPGLLQNVRAGPLDESGWSLLAAHGSAAAKLRQLLPRLTEALLEQGWPPTQIKVRVVPPASGT